MSENEVNLILTSLAIVKAKIFNILRTHKQMIERYRHSKKIEPPKITVNSLDEEWMENALAVVKKHLSEDKFSTDIFAREMLAYLFFCVKYERNLAFSYIKLYLCLRISYVQRR